MGGSSSEIRDGIASPGQLVVADLRNGGVRVLAPCESPSVASMVASGFGWGAKRGIDPFASASLDVRDFGGGRLEACAGCYGWGQCPDCRENPWARRLEPTASMIGQCLMRGDKPGKPGCLGSVLASVRGVTVYPASDTHFVLVA
jgi:hypothetical protein